MMRRIDIKNYKMNMAVAKYKIVRKCPVCGEEFFARTLESWYCSPKCSKVAWKRKHDEEKHNLN